MPVEVSQVRVGACYRAAANELRQVRAVENGVVSYVVVFHALNQTTIGPIQRIDESRFAMEAEGEVACP